MMRAGSTVGLMAAVSAMALTSCQEVISLDPVDERPVVQPRGARAAPITGGTLIADHGIAVAADPDRDRIHVVDISNRRVLHSIDLEPGDQPSRLVRGSEHRVHVVLRGLGGIATIDDQQGEVIGRRTLCPEPRGIAYDGDAGSLLVACASGSLIELDEDGTELGRTMLEPDIRDVVLVDGEPRVSLFRDASLIDESSRAESIFGSFEGFEPSVAWRTRASANGTITMLHQLASTEPVPIEPPPEEVDPEGGDLPYGGGGSFCEPGLASVAVTVFTADGFQNTTLMPDLPLTVDAATSPDGNWIALAMPGAPEGEPTLAVVPNEGFGCFIEDKHAPDEQITSVAFDTDGTLVALSREPSRLLVMSRLPFGELKAIELGGGSRFDTGHEIFHRATESGLSCATCHPEGTDDGHVWNFVELGGRRTQPLDVGLAGTAPFHWDGDMDDMDILMEEVLGHRMGGKIQSAPRRESFESWVFAQQRPPANAGMDDLALVAEGEALFSSLGCNSCHFGDKLGGTTTETIRGKPLQVPSLVRVSLRPPYMHDGRSKTLDDSVVDMIETTTTVQPDPEDVAALSAYLRTL